jgi:hypothetical protein
VPEKLERCVEKVKKKKGTKSAWAICQASVMGKGKGGSHDDRPAGHRNKK